MCISVLLTAIIILFFVVTLYVLGCKCSTVSCYSFCVQVNPLFDPSGATTNMGANLLFEILCVLPGVKYFDSPKGNVEF